MWAAKRVDVLLQEHNADSEREPPGESSGPLQPTRSTAIPRPGGGHTTRCTDAPLHVTRSVAALREVKQGSND